MGRAVLETPPVVDARRLEAPVRIPGRRTRLATALAITGGG
jgi:hypothetical protein